VAEADAAITRVTEGTSVSRVLHHQFFAALLLPALSRVSQKIAFAQTAVDTAAIACALERYRLAHEHLPDSLEKLSPEFTSALPNDIVSGKPLHYRLDADGHYVLYSIGWNQKDDDGQLLYNKGGEPDQKEGDWVWTDNF
jgi:hypothetical protein